MPENQENSQDFGPNGDQGRSVSENIHELTESTRALFAAGERLTENLTELEEKAHRATDLKYQISQRPWLIPVLAVAGGVVGWRLFSHKHA